MLKAVVIFALAVVGALAAATNSGDAQSRSYWLERGGTNIGSCAGQTEGEAMKAANRPGAWTIIAGNVTCRDAGSDYVFEVIFLSLAINPIKRDDINREVLNFDWIGLAVYAPKDGGTKVDWLYDEALPVRASLQRNSTDKVYIGNLKFTVPKAIIARATNFMFYITAEGPVFNFGLL